MATTTAGTFESVALELSRALQPLADRLHEPHHTVLLLAELGLRIPEDSLSPALLAAIHEVHRAAHDLGPMVTDLQTTIDGGSTVAIIAKSAIAAQRIAAFIEAIDTIATEIAAMGAVPGVAPADLTAFIAALPQRMFEKVVVEYFEGYHRLVHALLEMFGIIEKTRLNIGSSDAGRPEILVKSLHFDRIGALLTSPEQLVRDLYGWGDPGFDGALLLQRVATLLRAARIPVTFRQLPGTPPRFAIEVCVLSIGTSEAGVVPPGLDAMVTGTIASDLTFDLPIAAGWLAHLRAEGALAARAGIRVQPPANITVIPPSGTAQGRLTAGLARIPIAPATRIPLLGAAGGTGLSAERIGMDLVAGFRWDSATGQALGDLGFEARVQGGKLVISMGGADGFIGQILSGVGVEADFSMGVGWSTSQGVYFTGSSTLEIQLPAHISLGPVEIDALTLSVGIDGNRFPIGLAANIKAALGPLVAVVEQVGTAVELSFPADGRGDVGPLDIDFKFKPPKGVGLSLDAGVVKGGGYLFIDAERGEYAGALELTFSGVISLKAIGMITTRMPDGSSGFSLLIIITAEFGTGIQLGFGFTLLAVGGLIGLNRTMSLQPLMEGVRSGAIESVMFPHDVVANAARIISDLRTFFPPKQGTFLIGPMAKLGWGTPTLISVSLGVIIEIPGNIAIVGVLKVAIPTADAPLILLQVNFAGAIEFDKKRIYFFAALFESRIVFLTIEGEMGLLVAFGSDANFVVSLGGFHPRFSPPPLPFPSPRRIAVSLLSTPVSRLRVECYFAVTSNTVQFGARVEVFFGLSVLNVQGHFAFDALFQFSPFYFIIELSASFSVKVFGMGVFSVSARGTLDGPAPYHVRGHGSISFLFWDLDVDFEETWGETRNTELPPIAVMPMLTAEIAKAESWVAELPSSANLLVSLRRMPPEEAALVLHPLGVLRVSQRALPLQLRLDKVGSQKPSDVNRLSVLPNGGGLSRREDAFEPFAPAQFQTFTDAEKLSKPAFSNERSGITLSAAGPDLRASVMVKRVVRYEEIIIDTNYKRFQRRFVGFVSALFHLFLNGNAIARSELSRANQRKLKPFEEKITVNRETWSVALQANNQAYSADSVSFHSEASARDFMERQINVNASLVDVIHVVPGVERAA